MREYYGKFTEGVHVPNLSVTLTFTTLQYMFKFKLFSDSSLVIPNFLLSPFLRNMYFV